MSLSVERLFLYPVKSCAGLEVSELQIGAKGPQIEIADHVIGDRQWMFVDDAGKFVSQRSIPAMARLHPVIRDEKLFLNIDQDHYEIPLKEGRQRLSVSIWGHPVDASLVDGAIHQAASQMLGRSLRLVQFDSQSQREAMLKGDGLEVQTRFTDSQPYLMTTEESLKDLNSRLVEPIPMDRFRPNVVLSGAMQAFAEDQWLSLNAPDILFESTKSCARCKVITVDQTTGVSPSAEPLQILATFRKRESESGIYFGQYFISKSFGAVLKKGQKLAVQSTG